MKKLILFCLALAFNATAQNIDQQQTNNTDISFIPPASVGGQSFVPGLSGYLSSITVRLTTFSPPQSVIMDIYTVDSNGVPVIGTALATSSVVSVTAAEMSDYTFYFLTPASVVAGSQLAFGLRGVGEDYVGVFGAIATDNSYPSGKAFGTGDGQIFESDDNDTYFITNVSKKPLPVKLISFTAKTFEGVAELNWQTSTESNSSHFGIDRSLDGRNFKTIGTIKSAGNSSDNQKYGFMDTELSKLPPTVYYRLRSEDLDGSFTYSQIVSLENVLAKSSYRLYPNPVASGYLLQIDKPLSSGQVSVYNELGRVIQASVSSPNPGKTELNLGVVPAGIYFIRMSGEAGIQIQRIIIK